MNLPIVPMTALLLVFGVPYLVIFLQGRRLTAIEARLAEISGKLTSFQGHRD